MLLGKFLLTFAYRDCSLCEIIARGDVLIERLTRRSLLLAIADFISMEANCKAESQDADDDAVVVVRLDFTDHFWASS